jgi:hypothetical protein
MSTILELCLDHIAGRPLEGLNEHQLCPSNQCREFCISPIYSHDGAESHTRGRDLTYSTTA